MAIARFFYYSSDTEHLLEDSNVDMSKTDWDNGFSFIVVYDVEKFLEKAESSLLYLDFLYSLRGVEAPVILGRNEDDGWENAYDIQSRLDLIAQEYESNIVFLKDMIS